MPVVTDIIFFILQRSLKAAVAEDSKSTFQYGKQP